MPIIAKNDEGQGWPTEMEKKLLLSLVYTACLEEWEAEEFRSEIEACKDYQTFQMIEYRLEAKQQSIHSMTNPSQSDINKHLRKVL